MSYSGLANSVSFNGSGTPEVKGEVTAADEAGTGHKTLFGTTYSTPSSVPASAASAVLLASAPVPGGAQHVKGLSFFQFPSLNQLTETLVTTGFQATHLGQAIDVVNAMLDWRPECCEEKVRRRQEIKEKKQRRQKARELLQQEGLEDVIGSSEDNDSSDCGEDEEDTHRRQQEETQEYQKAKRQNSCSIG